jgi:hypothetical protein
VGCEVEIRQAGGDAGYLGREEERTVNREKGLNSVDGKSYAGKGERIVTQDAATSPEEAHGVLALIGRASQLVPCPKKKLFAFPRLVTRVHDTAGSWMACAAHVSLTAGPNATWRGGLAEGRRSLNSALLQHC